MIHHPSVAGDLGTGERAIDPVASPRSYRIAVVLPVLDEERILDTNVRRLYSYLERSCSLPWHITIVDNGSSDATWTVAQRLVDELPNVGATRLAARGRGRAIRTAWLADDAEFLAYMDIDLSTHLDAFPSLLAPLTSGSADISIGNRLAPASRVIRSARREFISRSYNLILRTVLGVRIRDAQCGFKAARAAVVRPLLAEILDDGWFFDTELLVAAERAGLRVKEVPVVWVDDPDSSVSILRTAIADLCGVWRLARSRSWWAGRLRADRGSRSEFTGAGSDPGAAARPGVALTSVPRGTISPRVTPARPKVSGKASGMVSGTDGRREGIP